MHSRICHTEFVNPVEGSEEMATMTTRLALCSKRVSPQSWSLALSCELVSVSGSPVIVVGFSCLSILKTKIFIFIDRHQTSLLPLRVTKDGVIVQNGVADCLPHTYKMGVRERSKRNELARAETIDNINEVIINEGPGKLFISDNPELNKSKVITLVEDLSIFLYCSNHAHLF